MKLLNGSEIRLMLVGFVVILFLGMASVCSGMEHIWMQKADMPTPRWSPTSAVVDGRIYVIGGGSDETDFEYLSNVEEYDPATDTWSRKTDMPTARGWMSPSSAVVDGKIYVIGGDDGRPGNSSPTVEEYDPATDTWSRKTDMPTSRWGLASCSFNGKIYAIGGYPPGSFGGLKTVEVYDPETDTWTSKADMPVGLALQNACVVNEKIYAIGGRPNLMSRPNLLEYDPATDIWTQKSDMPVATSNMGSVVFGNKIVVIGGWDWSLDYPYTTVQMYDPGTDTWTIEADAPFLRATFSAEIVNNRIYAIGGTDRPHPCPALSTVYEFGPLVDFNADCFVDISDLLMMIDNWGTDESLCDIGPMPWGDSIVDVNDLEVLMSYWGQQILPLELIAYWRLDETEGDTAYDSIGGEYDAGVFGGALWQPTGGQVDGAILLDGIDDYIRTPFIVNPAGGKFSIFAWIKGGAPGQVIFSQADNANWLLAEALEGKLMTELQPAGRTGRSLISDVVITDDNWHRVGLVWDYYQMRMLYVDDVEVAGDTPTSLESSEGGLYIGAGKDLQPGIFWSGLIDDVRIYDSAITP